MKKIIVFVLLFLLTGCAQILKEPYNSQDTIARSATVVKVIDGDTIDVLLDGKVEKIRLVGIDTPEPYSDNNTKKWFGLPNDHLKKWGVNAKDYTYSRLYRKEVNVSYDSIQGQKDYYGRTLAYIIIDNNNFNLELVENGYARVYTEKKSDMYLKLLEVQTRAQLNKTGLWNYDS